MNGPDKNVLTMIPIGVFGDLPHQKWIVPMKDQSIPITNNTLSNNIPLLPVKRSIEFKFTDSALQM